MAMLDFPASPTVGQEYEFPPYTYVWDGEKWKTSSGGGSEGGDFVPITGGTITGTLVINNGDGTVGQQFKTIGTEVLTQHLNDNGFAMSGWVTNKTSYVINHFAYNPDTGGVKYFYLSHDPIGDTTAIRNPITIQAQGTQSGSLTRKDYTDTTFVKKAGDTMTGDLSIASASNTGMLKLGSNNQQYLQASSDNNIYLFANNGKIVFKGLNLPVVRVGSTDHLIYHAGNKPTNKDVNAGYVTPEISFGNNSDAITTAQFITLLDGYGAFDQFHWYTRGSWSYAANQVITDTGCGNIHLAGCVVEVFHKYGNGTTDSGYTIRVTGPTTTGGSGTAFGDWVYVNNGDTYMPGWRRMYNTKLPPTALEVGAASIEKVNELESMIAELRTEIELLKKSGGN